MFQPFILNRVWIFSGLTGDDPRCSRWYWISLLGERGTSSLRSVCWKTWPPCRCLHSALECKWILSRELLISHGYELHTRGIGSHMCTLTLCWQLVYYVSVYCCQSHRRSVGIKFKLIWNLVLLLFWKSIQPSGPGLPRILSWCTSFLCIVF